MNTKEKRLRNLNNYLKMLKRSEIKTEKLHKQWKDTWIDGRDNDLLGKRFSAFMLDQNKAKGQFIEDEIEDIEAMIQEENMK